MIKSFLAAVIYRKLPEAREVCLKKFITSTYTFFWVRIHVKISFELDIFFIKLFIGRAY